MSGQWPNQTNFSKDKRFRRVVKGFDNFQTSPKGMMIETIRPAGVFQSNNISAVFNVISPNSPGVITSGFKASLNNNSTEILPSSSPSSWKQSGDAIWCRLSRRPMQLQFSSSFTPPNMPSKIENIIATIQGMRLNLTVNSGNHGNLINTYFWAEYITTDWNPSTLNWSTRPFSWDTATWDAAGERPVLSNAIFFPELFPTNQLSGQDLPATQSLSNKDNPQNSGLKEQIGEQLILQVYDSLSVSSSDYGLPDIGIGSNTSFLGAVIGTPTTTTIKLYGLPFGYVDSTMNMTLQQEIFTSQFNVAHNFIGGIVQVTPWFGDLSRSTVYSTVTDYDGAGTFTISPALPWAPQVGIQSGPTRPDFTITDSVKMIVPYYGIAWHLYAASNDTVDPKNFYASLDILDTLSFATSAFNIQTGLPI